MKGGIPGEHAGAGGDPGGCGGEEAMHGPGSGGGSVGYEQRARVCAYRGSSGTVPAGGNSMGSAGDREGEEKRGHRLRRGGLAVVVAGGYGEGGREGEREV
jgi:hypothetical protein